MTVQVVGETGNFYSLPIILEEFIKLKIPVDEFFPGNFSLKIHKKSSVFEKDQKGEVIKLMG